MSQSPQIRRLSDLSPGGDESHWIISGAVQPEDLLRLIRGEEGPARTLEFREAAFLPGCVGMLEEARLRGIQLRGTLPPDRHATR